ncbi:hypothetical protein [Methylocystis heyeri]|uniref:Uncharacterized protein n=1 Tax=Methylocystis heyeri TaxID=391905 RepID=A0A6B8KA45_9HYPH|nr:hypothetical protein [Methylocystis heyeri]QGM44302.1 hypothetical protein H2LOC_000500 [Methylocystis heyeri]
MATLVIPEHHRLRAKAEFLIPVSDRIFEISTFASRSPNSIPPYRGRRLTGVLLRMSKVYVGNPDSLAPHQAAWRRHAANA